MFAVTLDEITYTPFCLIPGVFLGQVFLMYQIVQHVCVTARYVSRCVARSQRVNAN